MSNWFDVIVKLHTNIDRVGIVGKIMFLHTIEQYEVSCDLHSAKSI